ncbi:TPA: AAA family ATPase [Providencia rettgeri]|uniref:AAA family ATPase n=1 Tax=Morganellaceae TaxID=1903414 RepID=UPI0018C7A6AB|nr:MULTISPECIES: ATP-binding protein [Morganellaceae]MBG2744303.1 AAA family ATPase [Proteus mirabilis]MBG5894917.1 AAA family ATPase [Providencia rettgeri]MBG5925505.1 AAA family ATPase [Providencia rettgeri]MCG5371790.1 ATP-binding protein [Providencia rettgeri]MCL0009337.1 ATP-binding protein [Providencia rettgeri]
MLYKFSVEGFKGFSKKVELNLQHRKNYEFNIECIRDGVINKSVVYGKNGCGKSNLGIAIFDIVSHLTEFSVNKNLYRGYLNAENDAKNAIFEYDFKFKEDHVKYKYSKKNIDTLIFEELFINDSLVLSYNRETDDFACFAIPGTETLNSDLRGSSISIINYIKTNAILKDSKEKEIFESFITFVNKMLYFRSLDSNNFMGLECGNSKITPDIIKRENVGDFEKFLNEAGVECKLAIIQQISSEGEEPSQEIAFDFGDRKIPFFSIASTGTKSLALFYYWLQRFSYDEKTSFVFVDEFDAFYHHSLSLLIVKKMKEANAQVMLTTHNTNIMSNDLLRPDCYFILEKNNITPIYELTDKELREAHNIEKMYKSGAFNV